MLDGHKFAVMYPKNNLGDVSNIHESFWSAEAVSSFARRRQYMQFRKTFPHKRLFLSQSVPCILSIEFFFTNSAHYNQSPFICRFHKGIEAGLFCRIRLYILMKFSVESEIGKRHQSNADSNKGVIPIDAITMLFSFQCVIAGSIASVLILAFEIIFSLYRKKYI